MSLIFQINKEKTNASIHSQLLKQETMTATHIWKKGLACLVIHVSKDNSQEERLPSVTLP